MNKVFCIGMFKTGTTSVGRALEKLGFRTFHGSSPYLEIQNDAFNWSADAFAPHLGRVKNLVNLYDAFEDSPFMWIYKEMQEAFPDAKFILTERDSAQVARSDINMWKQLGRHPIPEAHQFIDRYERHHDDALEYFGNSKQLLTLRLGAGNEWQKICNFLELPVPTKVAFPRAHVRPYGKIGSALFRIGRPIKNAFRHR